VRLFSGICAAVFLGVVAPVLAHPGHGQFVMVDVARFAFSPARAEATAGEEVLWHWSGPDRRHTVTADPGQAEAFDSDPGGVPGPAGRPAEKGFSHQFRTPGTYTYRCKVHDAMRGEVVVLPAPPPDPAPVVSSLRAPSRASKRVTLRFSLSEPAVVLLEVDRVRRGRAGRLVLSRSRSFGAGPGRLVVNARSLRAGAYRFQLVAVDPGGNAGQPARAAVRIVR
jgi:plastocyanin